MRRLMKNHLADECILRPVLCVYSSLGCEASEILFFLPFHVLYFLYLAVSTWTDDDYYYLRFGAARSEGPPHVLPDRASGTDIEERFRTAHLFTIRFLNGIHPP